MDNAVFFSVARSVIFGGEMRQPQVDGCNVILNAWGDSDADQRWVAYSLGTAFHETAHTMQPIAEIGHGLGRPYGKPDPATHLIYYGRGYVQLTWRANYAKLGQMIGVDLVGQPDRAMEPAIAAKVMVEGLSQGVFTGRPLGRYFNHDDDDWVRARETVNGLDKAELVAGYSLHFFHAMQEARA